MIVDEILPNIFKIPVPLPNNPLKELNSYILKGNEKNLLIDTGMNRKECLLALQKGIHALNINLKKTDILITHMHADHSGLVANMATPNSKIYSHQPDADMINGHIKWQEMLDYAKKSGMPKKVLENAVKKHPGYKYRAIEQLDFDIINDGESIRVGEYSLTCIITPGHTPGHICLYEPNKKILFSGDHILGDITPNISLWKDEDNPLKDYLNNLDRIKNYPVDIVLPAHRRSISNCKNRINELKKHHYNRLNEITTILEKEEQNAYQVASKMNWDMTYKKWDEFPVPQKWFATGEVNAHLRYLLDEGEISRRFQEGIFLFYK